MAGTHAHRRILLFIAVESCMKSILTGCETIRSTIFSQPRSPSPLASTANLLENNQIKADGQIGHYVPELKGTAYEDVTIRHCLDMMSGVSLLDVGG